MSVILPTSHYPKCCSFITNLGTRNGVFSNIVFHFQDCFGLSWFYSISIWILGTACYIKKKLGSWDFEMKYVELADNFLGLIYPFSQY